MQTIIGPSLPGDLDHLRDPTAEQPHLVADLGSRLFLAENGEKDTSQSADGTECIPGVHNWGNFGISDAIGVRGTE